MIERLIEIEKRYEDIENQLLDPNVSSQPSELQRLGKARADLEELVDLIRKYKKVAADLEGAIEMMSDSDLSMREEAQAEHELLKVEAAALEERLRLMMLPHDPNDKKAVIIEVRPAAGGDEAGLFAAEIFRMYTRYAERRKWKFEVIDLQEEGIGGLSRVVFEIQAKGAYSQLKHESGVHRVQRVPATESGGRLHTSTVTVAVLPEAEVADVDVKDEDLEISTFRSSSAGGQHMQKNETAIRVVHKPSGIVVTCQDERSQQQNKLKALTVLRSKLYEAEQERLARERGEQRRGQIGSGDRSEKIRTYHFTQNRVTDHRIGMDIHNIVAVMDGDIQAMIDALIQEEQSRLLAEEEQRLASD